MNPQPGTPVTLVPPSAVKEAKVADNANSGEVTTVTHREPRTQEEKERKRSWIEVEMVDEEGAPVPGTRYRITLPDGRTSEGTLDAKGLARVSGFEPGTCKISFPELDDGAWEPS